ncbi:MAG: SRPBCC family protein, partial [Pseudomonadota bacterium]
PPASRGARRRIVAIAVVVGFFLPREVTVERSVVIDAPQEAVFEHVNSMNAFNAWSPWYLRDPDAMYVIQGPEAGVGSKMTWRSEQQDVGSGSQEIIESQPPSYVRTTLDFGQQGVAEADFTLEPAGTGGTKVTWGFETDMGANPLGRYFGLMMDGFIGKDYETGLAKLKEITEAEQA